MSAMGLNLVLLQHWAFERRRFVHGMERIPLWLLDISDAGWENGKGGGDGSG